MLLRFGLGLGLWSDLVGSTVPNTRRKTTKRSYGPKLCIEGDKVQNISAGVLEQRP